MKSAFRQSFLLFFFLANISLVNLYPIGEKPGGDSQQGIQFKSEYNLYVYPVLYKLPEDKKYIKNIFTSIILDRLKLIKNVAIQNPAPQSIVYPKDIKSEDPRQEFLRGKIPKVRRFDLKVRLRRFPREIKKPEKLLSDHSLARFFVTEDLHWVGAVEKAGGLYRFNVYVFRNGKLLYKNSTGCSEIQISERLRQMTTDLYFKLSGEETGLLEVTANEKKASVYLNEQYIGSTPLGQTPAFLGENTVTVIKNGFEKWSKKIHIEKNVPLKIFAKLEGSNGKGKVRVISSLKNVDVYFDVEHVGKTPVTIEHVNDGTHRLRLHKDGFIDYYKTVTIDSKSEEALIKARLQPGDSIKYYDINRRVLGPLTFEKLFKVSAFVTMVSGLTGLIFELERQNALDSLRAFDYKKSLGYTLSSADLSNYSSLQKNGQLFSGLETGFFIGTGVFAITTIYFFIRYIGSQDLKIAQTDYRRPSSKVSMAFNFEPHAMQFSCRYIF